MNSAAPLDGLALPTPSRGAPVLNARLSTSDLQPPAIPDHTLLQPIGSGAYGEVWLARNAVGTPRAVKIVRRDQHASTVSFEREFKGLQKFEPISRSHDGLVDILTLGLLPAGAGFYYVMELADGVAEVSESAGERVGGKPGTHLSLTHSRTHSLTYNPRTLRADLRMRGALPAADVLALGLKLTAALAHLHAQGLVHRDVKPTNILFIGGEPKLADAGLVAAMDDARSLVGTAGYIAPEGPGTPQADLYALGKVLYESAFGKDRQEFPALPADIASRPDHARLLELNAILLKACATDPRERYQSADQIRADLELLQAGRSVKQRQAWAQTLHVAKNVGLVIGTVAILCAAAFWLAVREARPRPLEWSKNEQANEAYRNGISLFHLGASNAFVESAKLFELAVQQDPNFARANARLARSYVWQNPVDRQMLAKARGFAQRAYALNPNSDEANTAMASIKTLLEYDWSGAEKHHLKAISLNPDGQHAEDNFYSYATFLSIMARTNEAIKQVNKALALGSPSFVWMQTAGFVYLCARQYDQAIRVFEEMIRQQPSSRGRIAPNFLISAYRYSGNFHGAIQWEEKVDPARGAALREAYEKGGEPGYWRRSLDLDKDSSTDLVWLAILHARVGENDTALDDLEQALKQAPTSVVLNINREPSFDTLLSNPRFRNVRRKLGFE